MTFGDFIKTWEGAIRSEDDLQTVELEVEDMKKPIKGVYTHGWKIVDGDGVTVAEDEVHNYVMGDVPPEMVTEVEKLFAVDIPNLFWEVSSAWGDEAQDVLEDAGGDKEKAAEEMRKRMREKRRKRRKA